MYGWAGRGGLCVGVRKQHFYDNWCEETERAQTGDSMKAKLQFRAPEWLILIGGSIFIVVLAVSAFFEADIRWLHFFQAWMYVAAIALSFRGSRYGYFIGL